MNTTHKIRGKGPWLWTRFDVNGEPWAQGRAESESEAQRIAGQMGGLGEKWYASHDTSNGQSVAFDSYGRHRIATCVRTDIQS